MFYLWKLDKASSPTGLCADSSVTMYILFVYFSENNIENVLDHTFSVEHNSFGCLQEYELKPGGKDITVTEENKREYVRFAWPTFFPTEIISNFRELFITRRIFCAFFE